MQPLCVAENKVPPSSYSTTTTIGNLTKHFKCHPRVLAEYSALFPISVSDVDDSDNADEVTVISTSSSSSSSFRRPVAKRQRSITQSFTDQHDAQFVTQAVETFALLSLPHRLIDHPAFRALLSSYWHTHQAFLHLVV